MEKPEIKHLPGGPDPSEPIDRSPVLGHTLRSYARIGAELAARPVERAQTLQQHGLTELQWVKVEKTWALRIATALLLDDRTLAIELEEAQQDALAEQSGGESHSLERFAALTARLELGRPIGEILEAGQMTLPSFMAMQREWTARMVVSPTEAEQARRAIEVEKRKLSTSG